MYLGSYMTKTRQQGKISPPCISLCISQIIIYVFRSLCYSYISPIPSEIPSIRIPTSTENTHAYWDARAFELLSLRRPGI